MTCVQTSFRLQFEWIILYLFYPGKLAWTKQHWSNFGCFDACFPDLSACWRSMVWFCFTFLHAQLLPDTLFLVFSSLITISVEGEEFDDRLSTAPCISFVFCWVSRSSPPPTFSFSGFGLSACSPHCTKRFCNPKSRGGRFLDPGEGTDKCLLKPYLRLSSYFQGSPTLLLQTRPVKLRSLPSNFRWFDSYQLWLWFSCCSLFPLTVVILHFQTDFSARIFRLPSTTITLNIDHGNFSALTAFCWLIVLCFYSRPFDIYLN